MHYDFNLLESFQEVLSTLLPLHKNITTDDMKRILCFLVSVLVCMGCLYAAQEEPFFSNVVPPTSHGTNQGFSRQPNLPSFDKNAMTLVIEFIGATKKKSSKGNNHQFIIQEYHISAAGDRLSRKEAVVFEGRDNLSNRDITTLEYVAPFTFRFDEGEGEYTLYKYKLNEQGELEYFIVEYYENNDVVKEQRTLYKK